MKQHLFEQGPPLYADVPVALCAQNSEQIGVPLRGGFFNPLPGISAQQSRQTLALAARESQGAWSQFPESFAATVLSLSRDKCAPPAITWMPKGCHCIRPQGHQSDIPIVWIVDAKMAAVANRHLQALRAKAAAGDGRAPFIDFDHEGGVAGEVTDIFWDACGIRAAVSWTPEGETAVLQGRAVSFSPHWITHGRDFLGLRACVGGVLSPGVEPAFRGMPSISPWQKRKALHFCADRFMRKVDGRASELSSQGVEFSAVQAFEEVSGEYPELHACHELREAIKAEHWEDIQLRHP